MEEKVTVLVPVYNAEKYLDRCINSIVTQQYSNLEIILVNDGSKDESLSLCNEWKSRDERIKVIDKENGGVSSARNLGIEYATGKYICFVDSDDYISPDYVKDQYEAIERDNSDLCVSGFFYTYPEIQSFIENSFENKYIDLSSAEYENYQMLLGRYFYMSCNKLFKVDIIRKNGLRFDEKVLYAEDSIFNMVYLQYCKSVTIIDKCLYYYLVNNQSASRKTYDNMADFMLKRFEAKKKLVEKSSSLSEKEKNIMIYSEAVDTFGFLFAHYIDSNYSYGGKYKKTKEIYGHYKAYLITEISDVVSAYDARIKRWHKRYKLFFKIGNIHLLLFAGILLRKAENIIKFIKSKKERS